AAAGLLAVLLLYMFGRRRGRPVAGFVAAVVLATGQHYTWLSRVGRIDMPLSLAIALTLFAYYQGWARRQESTWTSRIWLLAAYLCVAGAVLLKGPIGIVLPAVVIGVHLLLEGEIWPARSASEGSSGPCWRLGLANLRIFHQLGLWWGLPLVLVLTAPLYLWVNSQTGGDFGQVFFWHHNYERGLGDSPTLASHPWWFYALHFAWDFLPWSPF